MELKLLRESKGLTQIEASKITSIPLRTYKRLENDSKYKSSDKYLKAFKLINNFVIKSESNKKYKIAVIGMGFVGYSLGLLLSQNHLVTFIDIDQNKVTLANKKIEVIDDRDIKDYLSGNYFAVKSTDYSNYDVVFIALPTNYDEHSKTFDTKDIILEINKIRSQNKDCPIVIKSTVDIGFTNSLNDSNIFYSPEFLKEGTAIKDSLYPDRIILGINSKASKTKQIVKLLKSVCVNNAPILLMSYQEAEAVKLFSNSYLALRVAFFNEIDSFVEDHNLDSKNVILGMSLDKRIGDYYNNPSFGFGGYCLPKDTVVAAKNVDSDVFNSISESNNRRINHVFQKIVEILLLKNEKKEEITIGFYNLNAKQGVKNSRSSSSAILKEMFEKEGYNTYVYDGDFNKLENCDIVLSNRLSKELEPIKDKVYSRDLFKLN